MRRQFNKVFLEEIETVPFDSAEEAWFWFCSIMCATERVRAGIANRDRVARPCEVNDIYRIVKSLMEKNFLNLREFKVMVKYGKQNQPPDCRFGAAKYDEILWKRGIAILSTKLKQKGIVVA